MLRSTISSLALLCVATGLSGCMAHTRVVRKVRQTNVVQSVSTEDLMKGVNARYESIQTMNLSVEITASTGGGATGQVKDFPAFSGYIFLRKPAELRVLLLVPVLRSKALDMVSDGKTFKLLIPSRNKAIVGANEVTQPSKNGLENLRPYVFLDSLLVRGPGAEQIVSRTQDVRQMEPEPTDKSKDLVEVPDYDLEILQPPAGLVAHTERVVHIGRDTLLPFQQEVYDDAGRVATRATYSNYQIYGTVQFPAKIVIERPLDQYSLTLTITKATFNEKLPDDQFELKIPETTLVQQMK